MNLSKKQVKALLDVLSTDDARPVLCHAKIDMFEKTPVLVATDSYKLTALKLSEDVMPIMGNLIPREAIIKWYKLASNKDYFTEAELMDISIPDDQGMFNGGDTTAYPKWQKLIPDGTETALYSIIINADYLATMQTLSGIDEGRGGGLQWQFYGALAPVIARYNECIYVVMPLKK